MLHHVVHRSSNHRWQSFLSSFFDHANTRVSTFQSFLGESLVPCDLDFCWSSAAESTSVQILPLLTALTFVPALNYVFKLVKCFANSFLSFPTYDISFFLHTIHDTDLLSLLSESPKLFYRIKSFIYLAFLYPSGKAAFTAIFFHITNKQSQILVTRLPYFTVDQLIWLRLYIYVYIICLVYIVIPYSMQILFASFLHYVWLVTAASWQLPQVTTGPLYFFCGTTVML